MALSKREQYIKEIFLPKVRSSKKTYPSEIEAEVIVKRISDMGKQLGFIGNEVSKDEDKTEKRKHKYDVWIAKEIKSDMTRGVPLDLINRLTDFQGIFDWASAEQVNLSEYSFEEAYQEQAEWHIREFSMLELEDVEIPDVDVERILFKCSDNNHFFYLLNDEELDYEGVNMAHCVSGQNYKHKVKNNEALIVSLRDNENKPHVTIEVNVGSADVIQEYGKMINEFALFASGFQGLEKQETLNFLNLNFH